MLEKEIEKKVCDHAKAKGFHVYKFSSPNHVGVPDRLFIGPGRSLFFIEFKRDGGKPTAMQEREAMRISECGFIVYLVDNVEQGKEIIDLEWLASQEAVFIEKMIGSMNACVQQSQADEATKH